MSSGASPFANGREAPQACNRSGDTPSSLKQFYATDQFTILQKITQRLKFLGSGETPPGHWSGATSSPWAVTGAREPYKQTLHNRSGAPPWSRAQLGTPEPPYYQVQVNILQQFL